MQYKGIGPKICYRPKGCGLIQPSNDREKSFGAPNDFSPELFFDRYKCPRIILKRHKILLNAYDRVQLWRANYYGPWYNSIFFVK